MKLKAHIQGSAMVQYQWRHPALSGGVRTLPHTAVSAGTAHWDMWAENFDIRRLVRQIDWSILCSCLRKLEFVKGSGKSAQSMKERIPNYSGDTSFRKRNGSVFRGEHPGTQLADFISAVTWMIQLARPAFEAQH